MTRDATGGGVPDVSWPIRAPAQFSAPLITDTSKHPMPDQIHHLLQLLSYGDTGWGDEMIQGLGLTLLLALCSYAVGFVIGLAAAGCLLSRWKPLRGLADAYTTVIRGVPEILIVFMIYFGGGIAIQQIGLLLGLVEPDTYIDVNRFAAGVVALATMSGAYQAEVLRAAFLAVPSGQVEAARAVGMSPWLIFRRVQFPQLLRFALPALGNLWLVMLKDTAIISVVGLDELLRASDAAGRSTREPFTFFLIAAVAYLLLTTVSMIVLNGMERLTLRGVARRGPKTDRRQAAALTGEPG